MEAVLLLKVSTSGDDLGVGSYFILCFGGCCWQGSCCVMRLPSNGRCSLRSVLFLVSFCSLSDI